MWWVTVEGDALHAEKGKSAGRRKSISKERPGNVLTAFPGRFSFKSAGR